MDERLCGWFGHLGGWSVKVRAGSGGQAVVTYLVRNCRTWVLPLLQRLGRNGVWPALRLRLIGRLLLLAYDIGIDAQGGIDVCRMTVVCRGCMVRKLGILIRRGSPVGETLIHIGRAYLGVWLGRVGVVVVPSLCLGSIGHQRGLLELAVPRLGIVLVDIVHVLTVRRGGVQVLALGRQLFTRHVRGRHVVDNGELWRSALLAGPTRWHGSGRVVRQEDFMRQQKGH